LPGLLDPPGTHEHAPEHLVGIGRAVIEVQRLPGVTLRCRKTAQRGERRPEARHHGHRAGSERPGALE